jgi:hypothetical protein
MPFFGFGFSASSIITQSSISAGGTDSDAQAFIDAAGITDSTQQSAINTLVTDLKTANIWTKMKAVYPIVGGSASSHKYNLVNPLDSDAAYRLAFAAGMTHASTGMSPGGTSYASTYLVPNTALTVRNTHLSIYVRTDTAAGNKIEMGCANATTANPSMGLFAKYSATNAVSDAYNNSTNRLSISNSDAKGYYVSSRTSSTLHKLYKNGSVIGTDTNTEANNAMPNVQMLIGSFLFGASVIQGTDREISLVTIGDGLSDADVTNITSAVTTFQTTLSRNV